MKSKKSLFNSRILKQDIMNFWPIWVAEILLVVFGINMYYYSHYTSYVEFYSYDAKVHYIIRDLVESVYGYIAHPFSIAVLCVITAVFVFAYMNNSRSAYMIHSLPVSRETLFISHYMSGIIMIMLPYILGCGVALGITAKIMPDLIAGFAIHCIRGVVEMIFFYSLAVLVVMVSGNSVMSIVIFTVANMVFYAMWNITGMIANCFLNSYRYNYYFHATDGELIKILTPVMAFGDDNIHHHWLYIIPAMVFVVLAYILYRYRKNENVGDMLAFKWCNTVFSIVFTVSASLCATYIFFDIILDTSAHSQKSSTGILTELLLIEAVFGVLCYIVSEMIVRKTFFVWKKMSYIKMTSVVAVLLAFIVGVKFAYPNLFLPDVEKMESATVSVGCNSFYFTDIKDLEKIVDLSREIILLSKDDSGNVAEETNESIYVDFWDESGDAQWFTYPCNLADKTDDYVERMKEIIRDCDDKNELLFKDNTEYNVPYSITYNPTFSSFDDEEDVGTQFYDSKECSEVYRAIRKDVDEGKFEIDNFVNWVFADGEQAEQPFVAISFEGISVNLIIDKNCENTIQALNSVGCKVY